MEYTVKTKVGVTKSGRSVEVSVSDGHMKKIALSREAEAGKVNWTIRDLITEIFDDFLELY